MRPKIKAFDNRLKMRYAHLKRDGIWLQARKLSQQECRPNTGLLELKTRAGNDVTYSLLGLNCDEYFVWDRFIANAGTGTILYGELFVPGQPASAVKHYMAENKHGMEFEVFAVGTDAPMACLETIQGFVEGNLEMKFAKWEFAKTSNGKLMLPTFWPSPDCEGVVYKNGNMMDWMKWKPVLTADLVVTGFTEGTGKYRGLIGAIECSLYVDLGEWGDTPVTVKKFEWKQVCKCSGMDDITREEISYNKSKYLNTVVEVAYQYVGAQGGLRHPRFIRFREDKATYECTSL